MNRKLQLIGSILAGDLLDLGGAIRLCERAGADIVSLDICDGHFVPTISFGEEVVRRTCQATTLPVEVHLMVSRPDDWLPRMEGMGQFRMLFHVEASQRAMGTIQAISRLPVRGSPHLHGRAAPGSHPSLAGAASGSPPSQGGAEGGSAGAAHFVKPGIAMNPETPAAMVETLLPYVDNVCVMGIAPGFAGQQLLEYTYVKIAELRRLIEKTGSSATITVDGGVKAHNAKRLVEAGADCLVVSSGMYGHARPEESLNEIRHLVGTA